MNAFISFRTFLLHDRALCWSELIGEFEDFGRNLPARVLLEVCFKLKKDRDKTKKKIFKFSLI